MRSKEGAKKRERPSRQNKDICRIPPPSLIEGLLPPSLSELEAKWNPGKIERKKGGHRSKKEIKTLLLLHFSQRKAREGRLGPGKEEERTHTPVSELSPYGILFTS